MYEYDERISDSEKQHNLNPYGEPIKVTGGPSFDERISDSEKQHNLNPYGEPIKVTGGPNYDERINDSEKQHNLNPYGEPIKVTGGPSFDERISDSEKQHNLNPYGEPIKVTGGPNYDERISDSEKQHNLNPYGEPIKVTGGPNYDERINDSEKQHNLNPYGEPIKVTGGPSYDERMVFDESQVKLAQERDKIILDAYNTLLKSIPNKKEDLVFLLSATEYRLDLMKKLVEHYRDQVLSVVSQYEEDYSIEASLIVNSKVTEYLCLIETLKSCGYNFGNEVNSYINSTNFDPYKPDVQLLEIMSSMHVRRKNDANIEMIFPVDYDLTDTDFQLKGDAVTIINNINEHLKNNPDMDILWNKAGYVAPEIEIGRTF